MSNSQFFSKVFWNICFHFLKECCLIKLSVFNRKQIQFKTIKLKGTRAAPKVMPLHPQHQRQIVVEQQQKLNLLTKYSITFCCHEKDGSRGAF